MAGYNIRLMSETDRLSLLELTGLIKAAISGVAMDYWVAAEISSVNVQRNSRHCYLDLVEKRDDALIAQMRATIWARDFTRIDREFRRATGRTLEPGMKLLMRARPTYHEIYGLSLTINDVDPAYTLGGIELLRKKIIDRLTLEGVINDNRSLELPLVPKRIAVVSSATAAGYGDFMRRLKDNPHGYEFEVGLFEAFMQGEQAERSVLEAMARARKGQFDMLAIIRGGGSQADLQCFDSYELARAVATFPIPVLAGIGHERDETVLDFVANRKMITPTATADFIVRLVADFEREVDSLAVRLVEDVRGLIRDEANTLERFTRDIVANTRALVTARAHALGLMTHKFRYGAVQLIGRKAALIDRTADALGHVTVRAINKHEARVERISDALGHISARVIGRHTERVGRMELSVKLLDPEVVLGRGYSITYMGGRALKDAAHAAKDEIITTRLYKGVITSSVIGAESGSTDGDQ